MKEIEEALNGDDAEARRRAAHQLGRTGDPATGPLLVKALGDEDWRVRKEAARVAVEVAVPWGLLPDLVDAIVQGENVGLRNAALEALERLGPRAANALLVALPRVPDGARKFLVVALGYAGGAGVERLAELSTDPDPNTAQAALEALARIGGPSAEAALRSHLTADDPVQRVAALEGLERLEATVSFAELEPLLDDRLVRRLALRTLGYCAEPEAVGALLDALSDGPDTIAAEVSVALGRQLSRGGAAARELEARAPALDGGAREAMRSVASDGPDAARRAATWVLLLARDHGALGPAAVLAAEDRLAPSALGAIRAWGPDAIRPLLDAREAVGPRAMAATLQMASELATQGADPEAIDALRGALRGELGTDHAAVALAVCDGLGEWAEAQDAAALVELAARLDEEVATRAGHALERLAARAPDAVEAALEGLSLEGQVGAGLLRAVAALGGTAATDRLQAALNADDPATRRAAVIALPRLGGEVAAELAGFALADEDVDVQVAAVRVLAELNGGAGEPPGLDQLRLALRATFEPVVAAAARALGAIEDAASAPRLRELVSEGKPGVAVAAMEALRTMDDPALDDLLVEALGATDEELVKEALRAIARRERPRRAARVALALEHAAWDVRQLAARLLGEIGTEEAAAALRKRAEREADRLVQDTIGRALAAISEGHG